METMTTGPGLINSLPSPPMEGKSPPSRASPRHGEAKGLGSPHEEASKMREDRRHQQTPSPAAYSTAHSPNLSHQRPKSASASVDDYEKGLVHCDICGEGVPFKDPQSGGFTLRPWDMHRDQCRSRHEPQPEPIVFTPETTVDSMANPPIKKRRAKRTEEERIEYLRTDPYVAQFEPYRVLCGSCNKWIRLRPNSTYCSIPWDAHRKSCLAKKAGTIPVEHRSPELNGTGAGRQLPSVAAITGNAHVLSVNGHNGSNGGVHPPPTNRLHSSLAPSPPMLSSKSRAPAPSLGSLPAPAPFARSGAGSPYATPTSMASGSYASGPDASPLSALHELVTVTGMIDSRRKNAEQRAAALRADPLIREVEPNRVFCGLCGKWVQLRQDSSFCAYPWHQHRSKCLARYERHQEKARIYASASASRRGYDGADYDRYGPGADHYEGDGSFDDELDSEDDRHLPRRHSPGAYSVDEDSRRYPYPQHHSPPPPEYAYRQKSGSHPYAHSRPPPLPAPSHTTVSPSHANSTSRRYKLSPQAASLASHHRTAASPSYTLRRAHSAEEIDDVSMDDEDGDLGRDADVDMEDRDREREREREYRARLDHVRRVSREYSYTRNHPHSSRPSALADLLSASGRLAFIAASVEHLFRTTYDRGDELSVVSLINYLNAAMPADKHDDFDVQEVTRAAASLAKSGALVLEGDRLRPRD